MTDDLKLARLVASLTKVEKATLCSGADAWTTKAIPTKRVPPLRMADGPHGVRYEDHKNAKEHGGHSKPATCFPSEAALACSFSPALARRVGAAMAEEAKSMGVQMLLGPGVNIKRSPLGGRNFEYYSEDPLLAGEMAAGLIHGLQENGVAASLKHFAVNNQEYKRMSINAAIDDRALFDLYLKPFEIAIRKARPATVMASYNRVNGSYATENRRLLYDILRMRFGFQGAVISDWGAVNDRPASLAAGLDLEMPGSGGVNDWAVLQAVRWEQPPEAALDAACWNLLRLVLRYPLPDPLPPCDWQAHHALAVEALEKSAVLLKNDGGMLPLAEDKPVAVVGEMAKHARYQGGGSSVMNPKHLVGFVDAMEQAGLPFTYAPGYRRMETGDKLLNEAAAAAKEAGRAVVFIGLPEVLESEGYDREHLFLPEAHQRLLAAVCGACEDVCVVLCSGSPVDASWLDGTGGSPVPKALLYPALGGEGIGEGVLRLLYGRANPAGKLAESWPLALDDVPCAGHFPMGPEEVTYNESIFCGYRYYDTANKPVRFPFGYGLSYTAFEYSGLELEAADLFDTRWAKPIHHDEEEDAGETEALESEGKAPAHANGPVPRLFRGQSLRVSFTLRNSGRLEGEEIVQLYLARAGSAAAQPAKELVAFCRVALAPGQRKRITMTVPYKELGFYDLVSKSRVVEAGSYHALVGASSRNLPLVGDFRADGVSLAPQARPDAAYRDLKNNCFTEEMFSNLYHGVRIGNQPPAAGRYNPTTTLGEMTGSWWGRRVLGLATFISHRAVHFSPDKEAASRASRALARDLPFKNLSSTSFGIVSPDAATALLSLCNGQGGFWRFLRELVRPKPYRKTK